MNVSERYYCSVCEKVDIFKHSCEKDEPSLEKLKARPIDDSPITHYSINKIFKAITLWPMIFKFYSPVGRPEPKDMDDWFMWRWAGVVFDSEAMYLQFGTQSYDILSRLVMANIIFPDGTYNKDFLQTYKQLIINKEEHNHV